MIRTKSTRQNMIRKITPYKIYNIKHIQNKDDTYKTTNKKSHQQK